MSHTQDYEHVLDLENVVGVEYDEDEKCVHAFVSKKKSENELDRSQFVSENVDTDSDVEEVGEFEAHHLEPQETEQAERHRPVIGGVSEINRQSTAATAGPYPVEVVDTSKGTWSKAVEEGDRVRVSNNHVYARSNRAAFGEEMIQPSPLDGGGDGDETGNLVGYLELEDGVSGDIAARTTDRVEESDRNYGIPDNWPKSVYREHPKYLKGKELKKTGRTTGVTTGNVIATSATITVKYPEGNVKLRDIILTDKMSEGGDSGSPVFKTDDGQLVGQVFAGSDKLSALHNAKRVEESFGIKFLDKGDDERKKRKKQMSLDERLKIVMEEPDLDLDELHGDKPKPGETVEVEAKLSGNYRGDCWVEVQDQNYDFSFTEEDKSDEGLYQKILDVEVTAPDEPREDFSIDVEGGYYL